MAASSRITYNAQQPAGGLHVANAIKYTQLAQQEIAMAMAVANSITGGGVSPANLEGSAEFQAATGGGAALYTAMNNLKANLAAVSQAAIGELFAG